MHEHTARHNVAIKTSSDRSFGLVFAAVFTLISLFPLLHGGSIRRWAVIIALVLVTLAFMAPVVLAPANRLWASFGMLLHRFVSPIALGILFFLVVTPTGYLMRRLGADLLRLHKDPTTPSYWINREPPGPPPDSLNRQF